MIIKLPSIPFLNVSAITLTPWLIIVNKYHLEKYSSWLIDHEKVHQQQMRRDGTLTFWFKYLTSKDARLAYELEAYRDSYQRAPEMLYSFGYWLVGNYQLNLTVDKAQELIKEGYSK